MTYAANLGRDRIIRMLHGLGAKDLESAFGRAVLQSKIDTAKHAARDARQARAARWRARRAGVHAERRGHGALLALGARVHDDDGKPLAPVDVVIQTDARNPAAKHAILEMYAQHGLELPDTPTMALHRGRIDLLEEHLRRDPELLDPHVLPPGDLSRGDGLRRSARCDRRHAAGGTTLLHMCVDYDELEIARWLLDEGWMSTRAPRWRDGFGGYTALFTTVVSQPNFWMNYGSAGPSSRRSPSCCSTWRRPQRTRVPLEAASSGTWRHHAARVSRRDRAFVGAAVSRADLRQRAGVATD